MTFSSARWSKGLRHRPQTRGIDDPYVAPACLDEATLLEVLQDRVHGLTGESDQVAEIGLIQPERHEYALIVRDAVIGSKIEQRVCDARMSAFVQELLDSGSKPFQPETHHLGDLVPKRRRFVSHPQQQVSTERAEHDIFMRGGEVIAR